MGGGTLAPNPADAKGRRAMNQVLLRARTDRVEVLTLNRPDQLNALSPGLQAALMEAAEDLAAAEDVDCVVICGAGRAFCAGFDLKAWSQAKEQLPLDYGTRLLSALSALPQPVIAAVHGICFTGGLELALAADFIVAAEGARFRDTHARLGLHAAWGITQRLPRRIGVAAAKELMFTSREVGGREALALGLAARCVPDTDFDAAVMACAREVAACAPAAVRWVKDQVDVGADLPLAEALHYELTHRPRAGESSTARLAEAGWKDQSIKAD
jgi:enoyl-CoA hydratase